MALGRGCFSIPAGLVPFPNRPDLWWLDNSVSYRRLDGIVVTAPQGFITDDASIPKFLDWIPALDRQGRSRLPGIIHDSLYSLGRSRGKAFADDTLREMCIQSGINRFWSGVIYQGVNLAGASAWLADRRVAAEINQQGSFVTITAYQKFKLAGGSVFS